MVKSRLGQSLLQLEKNLTAVRQEQQRAEAALTEWRERWLDNRDRISQRLELIETQLDQLAGEPAPQSPQFSIVGASV